MLTKRLSRTLWILALLGIALVAVRTFVLDIYRVSSSSMEPWLRKGEWVAVLYGRSLPERGQPIVFESTGEVLVKRAIGLGGSAGEKLSVDLAGDVWVEGERVAIGALTEESVVLFDQRFQDPSTWFDGLEQASAGWELGPAGLIELKSPPQEGPAHLGLARILRGGYLDATHTYVEGSRPTHDLKFVCEVQFSSLVGSLELGITEQADTFRLRLSSAERGQVQLQLIRQKGQEDEVLDSLAVGLDHNRWHLLSIENRDNQVTGQVGEHTLQATYKRNSFHPSDELEEGHTYAQRAFVRSTAAGLKLRDLYLSRDLEYLALGALAGGAGVYVEPGRVFVLGDNTGDSMDSRTLGSIEASTIIGRPAWVVWPPQAVRGL